MHDVLLGHWRIIEQPDRDGRRRSPVVDVHELTVTDQRDADELYRNLAAADRFGSYRLEYSGDGISWRTIREVVR